ncbi:MAG: FIST C-terminal domain-containing protein [Clostridiales Family XIII bacterium]|jgi:hypothetical protein|nr:FIST C-terminal domain-containing protein [Clostridiales Family XIII bacterium]
MIKAITAYTTEMDDKSVAAAEIMSHIETQGPLLSNSFGFVSCVPEFIQGDVLAAIAEALPFDIIGTTTIATLAPGVENAEWALTLLILTSDDVTFIPGLTEPLTGENPVPVSDAYAIAEQKAAAAGVPAGTKPAFIIDYSPLLIAAGGDFLVKSMSDAAGESVPVFGMQIVDNTVDYKESRAIYGADTYEDRVAFVLVYGDVKPKFYIATLDTEHMFRDKGVITGVSGNCIHTINDIPAIDYLASLGIEKDEEGNIPGINTYPFIANLGDGMEPIVRILFAVTPDGDVVCGGDLPKGSVISVGSIDTNGIVESTSQRLDEILTGEKPDALLIFSCVGRYIVMGYEHNREMAAVLEKLTGSDVPYTFTYAGGEMCPVHPSSAAETSIAGDKLFANRFHNLTFVALAL